MKYEISTYQKIFVNMAKNYVLVYPEHSFQFYFDDFTIYVADSLLIYTNLNNNSKKQDIFIYPNPTKNTLFVNFSDDAYYTIKIYDMHMKEVYFTDTSKEVSIDTKHWAKGMYYMHIFDKKESKIFKKIILF